MTQVVVPDSDIAERLHQIERAANAPVESAWSATDYVTLGDSGSAAILTDDAIRRGLLVLQFAADEAEILNLAVIPQARRQGLGRQLLTDGIDLLRSRGIARLFLEVASDNEPARKLYQAEAFENAGVRRNYYLRTDCTRVDAVIMARSI